jgi:hypothetical protein
MGFPSSPGTSAPGYESRDANLITGTSPELFSPASRVDTRSERWPSVSGSRLPWCRLLLRALAQQEVIPSSEDGRHPPRPPLFLCSCPNKVPLAHSLLISFFPHSISHQHHPFASTFATLVSPTKANTFHTLLALEYHRKHVFQNSCPRGHCWLCSCPASCKHLHLRLLHHCSIEEQHRGEPEDTVNSRRQHCSHWQL